MGSAGLQMRSPAGGLRDPPSLPCSLGVPLPCTLSLTTIPSPPAPPHKHPPTHLPEPALGPRQPAPPTMLSDLSCTLCLPACVPCPHQVSPQDTPSSASLSTAHPPFLFLSLSRSLAPGAPEAHGIHLDTMCPSVSCDAGSAGHSCLVTEAWQPPPPNPAFPPGEPSGPILTLTPCVSPALVPAGQLGTAGHQRVCPAHPVCPSSAPCT